MKAALITEEQIKAIEDAMVVTSNQNAHDMLLTGEELRELDKAIVIVKSLKVQVPVAWTNKTADYFELSDQSTVYGSHTIPLYAGEQP